MELTKNDIDRLRATGDLIARMMTAFDAIEHEARDWEFLEKDPKEVIEKMSAIATAALAGEYDEILQRQAELWRMHNRPPGRPDREEREYCGPPRRPGN